MRSHLGLKLSFYFITNALSIIPNAGIEYGYKQHREKPKAVFNNQNLLRLQQKLKEISIPDSSSL